MWLYCPQTTSLLRFVPPILRNTTVLASWPASQPAGWPDVADFYFNAEVNDFADFYFKVEITVAADPAGARQDVAPHLPAAGRPYYFILITYETILCYDILTQLMLYYHVYIYIYICIYTVLLSYSTFN